MKNKNQIVKYCLTAAFIAGALWSTRTGFAPGAVAGKNFRVFFMEMAAFVPLLFVLIGLVDVWLPRSIIERHVGSGSGIKGGAWVVFLAMLQAGPLYGAFPVAYLLWKKGCSVRNIFIYLGAFATLKLPMLTFEVGFLGWRFSLLRTLFTLPVFVGGAVIMEKILAKSGFAVSSPDEAR
jgi:uncharacterized membrane protein YraQ (UPF0718 family)